MENTCGEIEDDWGVVDGNENKAINMELMAALFPQKPDDKRAQWLKVLVDNEFEYLSELRGLGDAEWNQIDLPLAVKCTIKKAAQQPSDEPDLTSTSTEPITSDGIAPPVDTLEAEPKEEEEEEEEDDVVSQVDCVVIDISGSMRARSSLDPDKTREDVSKMLFHTLVDKLISLELQHAVGLLAFGKTVTPIGITREYERFHDELGRLDANQGATKLYDSIQAAGEMVEEYVREHVPRRPDGTARPVVKRIFVLTDGEDNASGKLPWRVAHYLQQNGLVLDGMLCAEFRH